MSQRRTALGARMFPPDSGVHAPGLAPPESAPRRQSIFYVILPDFKIRPGGNTTGGRTGWNVLTSINDSEAASFGADGIAGHDARYDRAGEFVAATAFRRSPSAGP